MALSFGVAVGLLRSHQVLPPPQIWRWQQPWPCAQEATLAPSWPSRCRLEGASSIGCPGARRSRGEVAPRSARGGASVTLRRDRAERLPASGRLRALRALGVALAVAAAGVMALSAPLRWKVGAASGLRGHTPLALAAALAAQSASVAAATEAATKGVNYQHRNTLLWLHAILSFASLASMLVAIVGVPTVTQSEVRGLCLLGSLFTAWATINGSVSFADQRRYPVLVQRYLRHHFGSVARGKSVFIKYHRTVGAMAFLFVGATACAVLALGEAPRSLSRASSWAPASAACLSVVLLLLPSVARRRFALPQISVSRTGVSVSL